MSSVSIVIPVYNILQYLPRCLDSVLSQTLKDIEILLIDDGSTDGSEKICDEYANKDGRVKVFHLQNGGVSRARNFGISKAQGEYIGFVDADDWIENDMYEQMYSSAKQNGTDIVICDCYTACGQQLEPDILPGILQDKYQRNDIKPEHLLLMAGGSCRCFYKRELLVKNKLLFPLDMKISEDRVFNVYAFGFAESVYYLKNPLYYRFVREGSAVNKYYDDFLSMVLFARNATIEAIKKAWDGRKEYLDAFENHTVSLGYTALNNEFYKTAKKPLGAKIAEIKRICNSPELLSALDTTGADDIRARLIRKKHYYLLAALSKFANIKNGR